MYLTKSIYNKLCMRQKNDTVKPNVMKNLTVQKKKQKKR